MSFVDTNVVFLLVVMYIAATKSRERSQIKAAHTPKCDKPIKFLFVLNISCSKCTKSVLSV